jgi:sugar-specific transcriptional regulator TrmB
LSEDPIKKILKDVGLTEKETEVYIFLAKHGALKGIEIAKQTRTDNAEVYRLLKSLQNKGILEATLEAPTRFVTVPFDKVIDSFVKTRRDEAALVESKKKDLLADWKKISKTSVQLTAEKFVVIEGTSKIYSKILQMTKEARSQLLSVSTVAGLVRAVQFGLFDAVLEHHSKSSIQFRFLTELTEKNANALKNILREIPEVDLNFRGRTPDLGLQLSPRMVVKDDEEVLFFTSPKTENASDTDSDDACLWTNCRAIVQAFTRVFEDLWSNSTDIYKKIAEVELGKSRARVHIVYNPARVKQKYEEALMEAKEEVTVLTSSEGLVELWKNSEPLRELTKRDVSVRVLAPVVSENLEFCKKLSESCDVRHVSESSFTTIIVDGRHLFQFRSPKYPHGNTEILPYFESSSYAGDFEHVEKAKLMLNNIWNKAQTLSKVKLESISSPKPETNPIPEVFGQIDRLESLPSVEEYVEGTITEKDVVNKIINAKRIIARNPFTDINIQYGSSARGAIHPPGYFNLPDMRIAVSHWNKQSSWGAEDWMTVYLWLETPKGCIYIPVAHVTDNPKPLEFRKGVYAGTPAGQNVMLVRKNMLQVQVQGNTLFAGWTMPIPLYPPQYALPPCCILFEGHGELKTGRSETSLPSGKTQTQEFNRFEAFVTFFHPSSKYSGPGTDGFFNREVIMTAYPPRSSKH